MNEFAPNHSEELKNEAAALRNMAEAGDETGAITAAAEANEHAADAIDEEDIALARSGDDEAAA